MNRKNFENVLGELPKRRQNNNFKTKFRLGALSTKPNDLRQLLLILPYLL
jgi:hypothetical protein